MLPMTEWKGQFDVERVTSCWCPENFADHWPSERGRFDSVFSWCPCTSLTSYGLSSWARRNFTQRLHLRQWEYDVRTTKSLCDSYGRETSMCARKKRCAHNERTQNDRCAWSIQLWSQIINNENKQRITTITDKIYRLCLCVFVVVVIVDNVSYTDTHMKNMDGNPFTIYQRLPCRIRMFLFALLTTRFDEYVCHNRLVSECIFVFFIYNPKSVDWIRNAFNSTFVEWCTHSTQMEIFSARNAQIRTSVQRHTYYMQRNAATSLLHAVI